MEVRGTECNVGVLSRPWVVDKADVELVLRGEVAQVRRCIVRDWRIEGCQRVLFEIGWEPGGFQGGFVCAGVVRAVAGSVFDPPFGIILFAFVPAGELLKSNPG